MTKPDDLIETPSQTAGPYVHIGLTPNFSGITGVYDADLGASLFTGTTPEDAITITGNIYDGTGTPLKDGLLEIWQADGQGRFAGQDGAAQGFTGWGRSPTDMDTGAYRFETLKPGRVPFRDGRLQAPHITMWIVARGINLGLHTRLYFADEEVSNTEDPILSRIEHQNRVPTLLAQPNGPKAYTFDIHLQGPAETIFFDI